MVETRASAAGYLGGYVSGRVRSWRTGSSESQVFVLGVLLAGITASFAISLVSPSSMPLAAYFVWLLVAMLLLRFGPLLVAVGWNAVAAVVMLVVQAPLDGQRVIAIAL